MSDLIKVNDKRLVFICTNIIFRMEAEAETLRNLRINGRGLYIVLIDINSDYSSFMINQKFSRMINLENYIPVKQISGFVYNEHLLLSMTYLRNAQSNYLSMFMIFSYPNGTDATIDISYYLDVNDNFAPNENFIDFLFRNFINENNIFRFLPNPCIRLVSIPD